MTVPNAPHDAHPPAPQDEFDARPPRRWNGRTVRTEVLIFVCCVAACALLGLVMGALWHVFAPRVPVYADSSAVYLRAPEGEQQIAADGWFAGLGLLFGAVCGALGYVLTRRREGGLGVALGLTAGGLAGAWVAWQFGISLSGGNDSLLALAKSVPAGQTFYRPLALSAKGVMMAWPVAALGLLMVLTGVLTPKAKQPTPHWGQGPSA